MVFESFSGNDHSSRQAEATALLRLTHSVLQALCEVVGAVEERIQFRGEAKGMVNVKGLWRLVAAATKLWMEHSVHCPLVASVLVFVRRRPGLEQQHSLLDPLRFCILEMAALTSLAPSSLEYTQKSSCCCYHSSVIRASDSQTGLLG